MKLYIRQDIDEGMLMPIEHCLCCFGKYGKFGGFYVNIRLPFVVHTTITDWYTSDRVTGFFVPIWQFGRKLKTVFPNRYEYKYLSRLTLMGIDEFYRESTYGNP